MASVVYKSQIPAVIKAIHSGAVVGVRQVAAELRQKATDDVPVDIGFLRASIYQVTSDASTYWQATSQAQKIDEFRTLLAEVEIPQSDLEVIVAYAASYALFVHDGTSRMSGRPWLQAALEAMRGKAPDTIAAVIAKAIAAAAKSKE